MTREELKQYLIDNNYPKYISIKSNKEILSSLFEHTSFLDLLSKIDNNFRLFCILYDVYEIPECNHPECNNLVSGTRPIEYNESLPFEHYNKHTFKSHCSSKCRYNDPSIKEKRKNTNIERYGHENFFGSEEFDQNREQYYIDSLGVPHPTKSEEVKSRIKETNINRYGTENPTQNEQVKEKRKKTNLERYGYNTPTKSNIVLDRIKSTNTERYGVPFYTQTEALKEANKNKMIDLYGVDNYNFKDFSDEAMYYYNNPYELKELYNESFDYVEDIADYLGIATSTVYLIFKRNNIDIDHSFRSRGEESIYEFVISLGVDVKRNDKRIISPYELDIVIPSKKVAIEFNGVYWHSEARKEKRYHQDKSIHCMDVGYQLIHVWEDQWKDPVKKEIIKDKIRSKLGVLDRVYARKCKIDIPDTKEVRRFYDNNHIQGFVGSSLHYGIYSGDDLVGCMSFKHHGDGVYELTRYATSIAVVGGMSKLLEYFKRNNKWNKIYTFAHLDYSKGESYEAIGFYKVHITNPGLWYVKRDKRYRRELFMKHKLKDKLESFDPSMTEKENMNNNGYLQLFDAGSIRYELNNE